MRNTQYPPCWICGFRRPPMYRMASRATCQKCGDKIILDLQKKSLEKEAEEEEEKQKKGAA